MRRLSLFCYDCKICVISCIRLIACIRLPVWLKACISCILRGLNHLTECRIHRHLSLIKNLQRKRRQLFSIALFYIFYCASCCIYAGRFCHPLFPIIFWVFLYRIHTNIHIDILFLKFFVRLCRLTQTQNAHQAVYRAGFRALLFS